MKVRYLSRKVVVLGAAGVMLALGFGVTAQAHDMTVITSFSDVGADASQAYEHDDAFPWKGYANIQVTNYGSTPWGDFHFELKSVFGSDVSNVDIVDATIDGTDLSPTTDRSPASYVIDNSPTTGATLDYYFYGDPVGNGQTANFVFYTDNTTDMVDFGLCMYPTPVPEPATLALVGAGVAGLGAVRRRRRQ